MTILLSIITVTIAFIAWLSAVIIGLGVFSLLILSPFAAFHGHLQKDFDFSIGFKFKEKFKYLKESLNLKKTFRQISDYGFHYDEIFKLLIGFIAYSITSLLINVFLLTQIQSCCSEAYSTIRFFSS